jgi:hypothetical protein
MASVGTFIGLRIMPLRLIICAVLWCSVGYYCQFCCDLASIFAQAIGEYDIGPIEVYVYSKLEYSLITFREY